jgi:hypothetical protein
VAKPPRHQRYRQRQAGHEVPRREPEPEHRGRREGRDQQLRSERRGAQAGGHLDLADAWHRARDLLAP